MRTRECIVVVVLDTTRPLDSPTYDVDSRWVVCVLRPPQGGGGIHVPTHSQTSILSSVLRISSLHAPYYPRPTLPQPRVYRYRWCFIDTVLRRALRVAGCVFPLLSGQEKLGAIGNLGYLLDLMAPKAPGRVAVSGAEGAGLKWRRRRRADSRL